MQVCNIFAFGNFNSYFKYTEKMQAFLKGKTSVGDKSVPSTSEGISHTERKKPATPWVEK